MGQHRFRKFLTDIDAAQPRRRATATDDSGFVLYTLPPSFSPDQQSRIQEIYRVAAERTREQLRDNLLDSEFDFSRN